MSARSTTATATPARAAVPRGGPAGRGGAAWFTVLLVVLVVAVVGATLLAVGIGAVRVPPWRVWQIVLSHLAPGTVEPAFT
ncbi:MAG: FecCD family ABC transporter permease, partial [Egibacteraceae bacterium]